MAKVGVVGATGYIGGELLRLLITHPKAELAVATSRKEAGEYLYRVHPNLRGFTDLKFSEPNIDRISDACDLVFTATPHGSSVKIVPRLLEVGLRVVDLSADFRLRKPEEYPKWYGWEHPFPDLLEKAVYGLPELHRDEIRKAPLVANPGCISTSAILALAPLAKVDFIDLDRVVVDSKIGSSAAGAQPSLSTHHPERSGVVRPYKAVGHRHTAEVEQEIGALANREIRIALSAHAVDIVRGILSTTHLFTTREVEAPEIWRAYRSFYANEPFIRFVRDRRGLYRLPDPKVVVGTNFCDIGFEIDEHVNRLVVLSSLDNLVKGGAGAAIQNMNIMLGIDETTGLLQPSLHPA